MVIFVVIGFSCSMLGWFLVVKLCEIRLILLLNWWKNEWYGMYLLKGMGCCLVYMVFGFGCWYLEGVGVECYLVGYDCE